MNEPNAFEVERDRQENAEEGNGEKSDEPGGEKKKGFDTPVTTPAEHRGDARRMTR